MIYIPKTNRRVGIHKIDIKAPKIGGLIKSAPIAMPKLPQINADMMPKPHPFPNKTVKLRKF